MDIVVCVKQVVDTEAEKSLDPTTWCLDRSVNCILNPYDEYAVEEALLIKEVAGGQVTVLCMGPDDATDAVRKALAMGADEAMLVSDPALAGSDAQATATVLAAAHQVGAVRSGAVRLPVDRRRDRRRAGGRRRTARPAAAVIPLQGRGRRRLAARAPRD